jgi:hypothetical protein
VQPDDLYGLPLDRFVPERAALAKALRGEGRRDEAAEVAKLRKPSAAAWAVNQLVRTQRDATRELLASGDALRAAQADVLAGRGDAAALREAGARERDAVGGLVDTARGLLGADGQELSGSTLERVADTLHAAALDDAAREQVREGRLERELRHVGLGLGEALAAAPATGRGRPEVGAAAPAPVRGRTKASPGAGAGAGAAADRSAESRAAKERAAAAAADEAARKAARQEARAAASKAAKREERAVHALRAAEERRDRTATALADADAALAAAREAAADAAEEHRRARAVLDER